MPFATILKGRHKTLERFSNEHVTALQLIAFDESIWQNPPYKIKSQSDFDAFVAEVQQKNLSDQQVTYVLRNNSNLKVCGSPGFINIDSSTPQNKYSITEGY